MSVLSIASIFSFPYIIILDGVQGGIEQVSYAMLFSPQVVADLTAVLLLLRPFV